MIFISEKIVTFHFLELVLKIDKVAQTKFLHNYLHQDHFQSILLHKKGLPVLYDENSLNCLAAIGKTFQSQQSKLQPKFTQLKGLLEKPEQAGFT